MLVERLSKGETRLDAAELVDMFRHVGLSPERLLKFSLLAETMSALTRRRLKYLKYRREVDMRSAPDWPEAKPALLNAGESGVGKTWQLGRLLQACADARQIATLVLTARRTEDLLTRASRDIWQTGLSETSDKSLVAVSHFLREIEPDACAPRLTVAVR